MAALPGNLFDLYRSYKKKTNTAVKWLSETSSLQCTTVKELIQAASSIIKSDAQIPPELYWTFKDALEARTEIAAFYKTGQAGANSSINSASNHAHDHFITTLRETFHILFPREAPTQSSAGTNINKSNYDQSRFESAIDNRYAALHGLEETESTSNQQLVQEVSQPSFNRPPRKDTVPARPDPRDVFMIDDPIDRFMCLMEYILRCDTIITDVKHTWEQVRKGIYSLSFAGAMTNIAFQFGNFNTKRIMRELNLEDDEDLTRERLVHQSLIDIYKTAAAEPGSEVSPAKFPLYSQGKGFEAGTEALEILHGNSQSFASRLQAMMLDAEPKKWSPKFKNKLLVNPMDLIAPEVYIVPTAPGKSVSSPFDTHGHATTASGMLDQLNKLETILEQDKFCLAMMLDNMSMIWQNASEENSIKASGEINRIVANQNVLLAELHEFFESGRVDTKFIIGLHFLLQTYKSFLFESVSDHDSHRTYMENKPLPSHIPGSTATPTTIPRTYPKFSNCRIQALLYAREVSAAIDLVVAYTRYSKTANLSVASDQQGRVLPNFVELSRMLQEYAASKHFDLYSQSPWVASSMILDTNYWAFYMGVNILNENGVVGMVLHAYNFLRKLELVDEFDLFDRLANLLEDAVFMGQRPSQNFRSIYFRYLGGELIPSQSNRQQRRKQKHDLEKKRVWVGPEGSSARRFMIDAPPNLPTMYSEDRRIKPENLSYLYKLRDKNYCPEVEILGRYTDDIERVGSVHGLQVIQSRLAPEGLGEFPVTRVNWFSIYVLSIDILTQIATMATKWGRIFSSERLAEAGDIDISRAASVIATAADIADGLVSNKDVRRTREEILNTPDGVDADNEMSWLRKAMHDALAGENGKLDRYLWKNA